VSDETREPSTPPEPSTHSEPLQDDEERQLREQVRRRLVASGRKGSSLGDSSTEVSDSAGEAARRGERLRVIREEEDRFYLERGLYRHKNHRGQFEWLTKEQIRHRRKRSGQSPTRHRKHRGWFAKRFSKSSRASIMSWLTVLGFMGAAVVVSKIVNRPVMEYEVEVLSVPPGAAIFMDGQPTGRSTNSIIDMWEGGSHTFSVASPGYRAEPPTKTVDIVKDEVASVAFTLYSLDADTTAPAVIPEP
jgi:hypothetical protein